MKVLIAAGGTGGHINPGLAIADILREDGNEVIFIGTKNGLEIDLVPKAGYKLKLIRASGIKRGISFKNIRALFDLFGGMRDIKKIIKEDKPDLIIGTGGYVTAPVLLVGSKDKIPTMIHESNALPGKTTKWLSSKVDVVAIGFKEAESRLPKARKVVFTGNPIKMKGNLNKQEIRSKLGITKKLVLVFGGSQGAKKINETMIELINDNKAKNYQIVYATGQKNYDEIISKINKIPENVKIEKYIYNMEEIMTASDLVVCRSGALTVTEIGVVGVPAILVPFPYAAENHQEYNAKTLENVGAAKIILEDELTKEVLEKEIERLFSDQTRLEIMSQNAHRIAERNVKDKIKKVINGLTK
jgi:UDP-N-acetylglucosamine--N-acetylmuramyl-(pentapeptide) pyrophosphoryl-undecaprenol N-acetylglucosamine transferase